jgi:hypothetical protein
VLRQSFLNKYSESLAFEMLKRVQIHQKHVLLIMQKKCNKQLFLTEAELNDCFATPIRIVHKTMPKQ